ncbi:hypothetical protein EV363DRAFT_1354337 [Boletus edulis]|nr:hypothetical protein EV363DRAFT_1354337 [Boletus edulis]
MRKQLYITLTEPVVFLRSSDPSGRLHPDQYNSPTLVRGILTLKVAKPIEISSIEVELTGVSAISYQEGIGPRRVDLTEKRQIYSSSVTVFRADQLEVPHGGRHSASVRPGPSTTNSDGDEHAATTLSRPPSLTRGRSERRCVVSAPLDLGPTPPYSVAQPPTHSGEHAAQTLEELRQALRDNLEEQARNDFSPVSSRSHSVFSLLNPTMHSSTGTQPSTRGNSHDPLNTPASHSRFPFSLTSVLDAVKEITSRTPSRSRDVARSEERERGRTRARIITEEQSGTEVGEGVVSPGNSGPLGPNASHLAEHREYHLLGLGRVFGSERDHEKDKDGELKSKGHGEGWREFKPGTYSYPISFLLPANLPPTFSLPYGSLSYAIKGVAHRPGTFTSKLSCQVPLLVVAAPAIGAGEGSTGGDPGPLIVENQWRGKLAYSFELDSRLFLLGSKRHLEATASRRVSPNTESLVEAGVEARAEEVYGTATLDLTLLPTEKIKIWKLDIIVDQHIRYVDRGGRPFRDDDRVQVRLLEVRDTKNKHKRKHDPTPIPLLPTPISPHRSPLFPYLPPTTDPSILAGPGPYTLSIIIGLPGCSVSFDDDRGPLHFSVKQKSSSVRVEHSLRIVGDEDTNDAGGERKRLVDITVQAPIAILSCRCVPDYQALPEYSRITEDNLQSCLACPCVTSVVGPTEQGHGHRVGSSLGQVMTPSSTSSFESEHGPVDEQRSDHDWSRDTNGSRSPYHAEMHSHAQHHHSHSQPYSVWTSHVGHHSQDPPSSTLYTSRPPSPLAQYERLVSGLESEAGEAPPSYESVALGP